MTRSASRIVAALGLATAISAVGVPHAQAGLAIVRLSPAQFVSNCQSMGGTSSPAPHGGIRCTLASGTVVDCSFANDGSAVCQWTKDLPPKSAKALMGDVPPDRLAPTTTKPPKATGAPDTVN